MVKVFISHSTSGDPQTAELRDAIEGGLKARQYDVLLDVHIRRLGEPWQLKLATFLGECDAALVLVNADALDSRWVRRETNILHWRKSLHPGMVLITVLVGDVTSSRLRNSELHYLADDDVARVGVDAPSEEAQRVVALFPEISQLPDVVGKWLKNIALHLDHIKDDGVFRNMATALGVPESELKAVTPGLGHLLLASQMLDTHEIERLANAVVEATTGGMDKRLADQLATMVLPVWVDRDQARRIVRDTDGSTRRVVILNVRTPPIGRHYLDRAFCVDPTRYFTAAAAAHKPGEEISDPESFLLAESERVVKEKIGLDPDQVLDHPDEPELSGRFFLLLDVRQCSLAGAHRVVSHLREKVPWINILVIPGRGVNVRESWPGSLDEVLVLDPPFGEKHETLVKGVMRRLLDHLNSVDRGAW